LQVLSFFFDDERADEFRRRLEVKLCGRHESRIAELKLAVRRAETQLDAIAQRMRRPESTDDEVLEKAYREQRDERRQHLEELAQVTAYSASLDVKAIREQLEVNPLNIIPRLFSHLAPVELTRAVLSRVFPRIVLLERPARFVAVWKIVGCRGATVSHLAEALRFVEGEVAFTVKVETGAARPTPWLVTVLEASVQ
jgi:hypothetical protein